MLRKYELQISENNNPSDILLFLETVNKMKYYANFCILEVRMNFPKIDMTPVSHPYPETTMFGAIAASAKRVPDAPALNFMGKYTTFRTFVEKIELAAGSDLRTIIEN